MGLRDTFLSGCWGSQVGKPSASLRHNKEMKLLQGHADLMKAGFGFPCTLKEDTVPYLCACLSEVSSRQETSVPIASFAHCQTAGYISWSTTAKSERSFASVAAPSHITREKMLLFPVIPLAPRIWVLWEDCWQHFTRLLWGGSSCCCKPSVWRQTLPPRPWCQPLTTTLPSPDSLKPRGSLAISLTMKKRAWCLFSSMPVLRRKQGRAMRKKYTLGSTPFPLISEEGGGANYRGVQFQLCCWCVLGEQALFLCFSFSIFAISVTIGIQLGKALQDPLMRRTYETAGIILLITFLTLPKTAGSSQGREKEEQCLELF